MDDFTQFDAFERCQEFARVIAGHLRNGVFSKDPVLTTALRKTLLSVYSNFGEGFSGTAIGNLPNLFQSPRDR